MDDHFFARYQRYAKQGLKDAEIAVQFGISLSTLKRRKRAVRLTEELADHSWAIPWGIRPEDRQSTERRYLRELSLVAQGRPPYQMAVLHTALRWARKVVEAGQDITYEDGWVYVAADPAHWHLRDVYTHAVQAAKRARYTR